MKRILERLSAAPVAVLAASIFILATVATAARPGAPAPEAVTSQKPASPSILLVTIDTLRADHVGCYGHKSAETPNLDRLAREGVRFLEARSHVPLTLPSHATILTGRLPPRTKVRANGLFKLASEVPTLASILSAKGYGTGAIVSSVVLDRAFGLDRGFALYDDNQRVGEKEAFDYRERGASQVADAAVRELASLRPPFFLWVHFYDPHEPWIAPPAFRARHPDSGYDAEIAFADAEFGEVWARAAERAGKNLIVAALSDHGESLGEHGENQHGYTLHRGVLRVPLILAGAGIPKGTTVRETVGLADLAPTLAEAAGTSMDGTDGKSLLHSSKRAGDGEGFLWEETLHTLYDSGWAPLRGLLSNRWHFVEAPRPELYDRPSDPNDRIDVAKKRPEVVREMRRRLERLAASMGDTDPPAPTRVMNSVEGRELREKLASLGYLAGGADRPRTTARLDPKDGLPGFLAVERAEQLIEKGKAKEASALLEPHLGKDPNNPRLWNEMGKALTVDGRLDTAEAAFRKAISLDPTSDFIRYGYAALLRGKKDDAGAWGQLEAVLENNPRAVDAAVQLAAMAIEQGQSGRAETILMACYEAGARDAEMLDTLGYMALRKNEMDRAAGYFFEALTLRPNDPAALLECGRAALRANEPGKAIDLLGRCTTGPRAFECRMELARAYVLGPRDLVAARIQLNAARDLATEERLRREVDERLAAIDRIERSN